MMDRPISFIDEYRPYQPPRENFFLADTIKITLFDRVQDIEQGSVITSENCAQVLNKNI